MKKLLSFIVASFSICSLFAEPLIQNNLKISKLALREISDGEDSSTFFEDEQDEKYEDKFEKRQKKTKGMRNMLTVSPLSLSFSSLNQIYAELSDTDIKPNLFSWNAQIAYEESNKPLGFDLHVNVGLGWAPRTIRKIQSCNFRFYRIPSGNSI